MLLAHHAIFMVEPADKARGGEARGIHGEIGFYDPIFRPALIDYRKLTFDTVERIRIQFCPHASLQATLIACATRVPWPAIYLEAGMGYKKDEAEQLLSGQLTIFPIEPPQAKLRALVVAPNSAARSTGIRIDRNMEVPTKSAISTLFHKALDSKTALDASARENLQSWRHSDGLPLSSVDVHTEARRLGDRVLALIRPTPLA